MQMTAVIFSTLRVCHVTVSLDIKCATYRAHYVTFVFYVTGILTTTSLCC